ncbi:MAG TPA: VCBS repeat-containing protein, partial [Candidatus Binatia bacterium]|nr:VCBS repeat-containing protein [Candidatus Binatia bacterium]
PHPGFVAVFLQDPAQAGQFLAPVTYDVSNDPVALVAGDLNGDGKPDLVSVNTIMNASGTGDSSVSVLLQDPANPGKFLSATNYPTGFSPVSAAIGDLNGDGRPDLAVSDTTGISILLQSSTAAGQFLPLTTIPVSNGGTSSIAIADLNGDGKPDLVATASDLNIFMQNPSSPGNFLSPVHYAVGAQPISIAVADLNADGHLDLAIANLGSPDGTTPASVSVLLQNPAAAGNFLSATNYPTGIYSLMIAAADLNGDGKPDLVVANMGTYTGGSVSVLLQDPAMPGAFQAATDYPESGPVSWVAVADLDGDGSNDLAIAANYLEIRFQDPANPGSFLQPIMLTPQ